jgi:hypothetical protein
VRGDWNERDDEDCSDQALTIQRPGVAKAERDMREELGGDAPVHRRRDEEAWLCMQGAKASHLSTGVVRGRRHVRERR